jgi:hypothetical protein
MHLSVAGQKNWIIHLSIAVLFEKYDAYFCMSCSLLFFSLAGS